MGRDEEYASREFIVHFRYSVTRTEAKQALSAMGVPVKSCARLPLPEYNTGAIFRVTVPEGQVEKAIVQINRHLVTSVKRIPIPTGNSTG